MNIVFLDVDGVLNCDNTKERIADYTGTRYMGVDDELVENLAKIVNASEAEIVLTSTWKTCWDVQMPHGEMEPMAKYLVMKLKKQGLHIIDRTLDRGQGDRGYGIKRWLKRFPEVERWIVLDDEVFPDYDSEGILPHLIQTDFSCGLTEEDVEAAIDFLTKPIAIKDKKEKK